jgi:hypothetical protein
MKISNMKKHAVMAELLSLKQDLGEPVRRFYARVVAMAKELDLTTVCPEAACGATVDITDFVIKHVVINGLADTEARKDVFHTPGLNKVSSASTVTTI